MWHKPAIARDVVRLLEAPRRTLILDGTVGMGGHAKALLEAMPPQGRLVGIDRDPEAVRAARERLAGFGDRAMIVHACYDEAHGVLNRLGLPRVQAILLDLGLSSAQLDDAARGLSFVREGPLDMRFDRTAETPTAQQILTTYSFQKLTRLFREFGEVSGAERLAKHIVQARRRAPFRLSTELADACATVLGRRRKIHPATLVFQALRIEVNGELDRLDHALDVLPASLAAGGTLGIISYHSLEDRRVKQRFRTWAQEGRGECLTPKPVRPGREEVAENPRARSARLRAFRMATA